jgi:hypothetical protein
MPKMGADYDLKALSLWVFYGYPIFVCCVFRLILPEKTCSFAVNLETGSV